MYNEFEYWNKRIYPTSEDELYTEAHLDYTRRAVEGKDRVLDFGPGLGRLFAAYQGIGYVEGYDISERYERYAVTKALGLGLTYVSTLNISGDSTHIPYDDKQFDVAIVCAVLMHQRPQHIVQVMGSLAQVATVVAVMASLNKDEVYVSHDGAKEGDYDTHCFNYDYIQICEENGWVMSNIEYFKEQVFFTYSEKGGNNG